MSLLLSELIAGATSVFEDFGDMEVFIDREEDEYECLAYEMRREVMPKTGEHSFVIADYLYKRNTLKLIK